jgi:hypothetical protein
MSATGADACGIRLSGDMIYGSGLRDGDANISTVPPYHSVQRRHSARISVAARSEADDGALRRHQSVRYRLIGVFAPQFGPRRGYFLGMSKKF